MKKLHAGILVTLIVLIIGILATSAFAGYAHYSNRGVIVPNISVADISLSGMDLLAATTTLQQAYDEMVSEGLTLTVGEETKTLPLFQTSSSGDVAYSLIDWDPTLAAAEALRIGHSESVILDSVLTLYYTLFGSQARHANVTIQEDRLHEAILQAFPEAITPTTPTDFDVTIPRRGDITIVLTDDAPGSTIDLSTIAKNAAEEARDLQLPNFTLTTIDVQPAVSSEDAEVLLEDALAAVNAAPYYVSGMNTSGEVQTWSISQNNIADWIIPELNENNDLVLQLETEKVLEFFDDLHAAIDLPAKNARFTIEGGKVSEFEGSTYGTVVDDDVFFADLVATLGTDTKTSPLTIATRLDEPSITTQNVNNLGIKEIIGEATTSYATSPANRKANIKHGAEKLNGLLIAPGETVSLLASLRPFTIADGYLPELVIKGDEIKPEVGGGLCQIGTTAFRAVMNTGLEVVERRNHSLAVSYYNDPSNGNPGTDATIYDPAPDFKFRNDMSTYILLVTNADSTKGEVTFTFWGTSDGREGSYTPPVVLSRTSSGATQYKETSDLPPGVQECQHGYPGATATFDYTIKYANGTEVVIPYFSSYRALPQICLVGKAVDDGEPASTSSSDETLDAGTVTVQ